MLWSLQHIPCIPVCSEYSSPCQSTVYSLFLMLSQSHSHIATINYDVSFIHNEDNDTTVMKTQITVNNKQ